MSDTGDPAVVETKIRDDRTILTIEGWPEASVIVRSASGERIYLPPENPEPAGGEESMTSPYSTGDDVSDDGDDGPSPTPYSTAVDADDDSDDSDDEGEGGRSPIPQGIRIIHPEPVIDVRVLE